MQSFFVDKMGLTPIIKLMKIKNINIKGNLVLAPMAGYSDVGLRSLAVKYGAAYGVTEMVSARALNMGSAKTIKLLETAENEQVKVVQLFGHDPADFAYAVKMPELGKFDIIDINMGCPVSKIVKNNEGSSLMKNPELARQIIRACVENTNKPISVKFRRGYSTETCVEFAKMCEEAGASLITIHARFASEGYSGVSSLEAARKVKQAVKIPVCYSGDIVDEESLKQAALQTGCDLFMVGRAAMGNPSIFAKLKGEPVKTPTQLELMREHININISFGVFNGVAFRAQASRYVKPLNNARALREKIFVAKTADDYFKIISEA